MSQHDDRVSLHQMLDHAEEVVALATGRVREHLDTDRQFQLSVLHLIQTVGEASRRISPEFRDSHTEVEWQEVAGMRSRIVHAYDAVDMNLVWDIIQMDLPVLIAQLRRLLQDIP
jgi:uncharacterized protein with HEPN domain